MTITYQIARNIPLFPVPDDFRVWAMNGAPSLAIAEQSAAQAQTNKIRGTK